MFGGDTVGMSLITLDGDLSIRLRPPACLAEQRRHLGQRWDLQREETTSLGWDGRNDSG